MSIPIWNINWEKYPIVVLNSTWGPLRIPLNAKFSQDRDVVLHTWHIRPDREQMLNKYLFSEWSNEWIYIFHTHKGPYSKFCFKMNKYILFARFNRLDEFYCIINHHNILYLKVCREESIHSLFFVGARKYYWINSKWIKIRGVGGSIDTFFHI
jgi:hypothetical protein